MYQENQLKAEKSQGSIQSDESFTVPYRHKGYQRALQQLRKTLSECNAVILKGVEGTGKSTLVAELVCEYEHKGVPVAVITKALPKAANFYALLADTLGVPKQKADLIQALRDTKEASQFCFVVIDQEAINSSPEVENALKQLCLSSETTAGAIKLIVVRRDYLVIHTEQTPEADFHNWIKEEVCLDPLTTDDIEGFIHYLSSIKGIQPTPYEIGTDFLMIEKTEGRIGRLKGLLLPLIQKDVITHQDIKGPKGEGTTKNKAGKVYTAWFVAATLVCFAVIIGINYFIFTEQQPTIAQQPAEPLSPVFAEAQAETDITQDEVTPPSLVADTQSPQPAAGTPGLSSAQEPEQKSKTPLPTIQNTTALTSSDQSSTEPPLPATNPTLGTDQFQSKVNKRLSSIEAQLSAAIEENQRLKEELANTLEKQRLSIAAQAESPVEEVIAPSGALETPQTHDNAMTVAEKTGTEATEQITNNESTEAHSTQQVTALKTQQEDDSKKANQPVTPSIASTVAPPTRTTKTETNKAASSLSDMDEAISVADGWMAAWQKQDHAEYIACYDTGFNGAYRTHQDWLKNRHTALTKPQWIKLERSEFLQASIAEDVIKLDFWLTYEAGNGYKDKTLKRLTLKRKDDAWLITKEQNIKVEPYY
ncbi:MAG: hypothetical protein CSA60_04370 [Neptuniibacter caesariensis]|uniref:Cds6 C-terminal domain-containing protein n=1 Tax=Neptuniibacter caesariensis TaxID=207954 RepID=A0A2G6JJP9_NEPCE|nr:MAG: hypothetical protein CSA60_04370 [Neptuniibacter caesariensis]